ncbi:hypothetical protein KKB43_01540, partial [Patescibacteria group bacterium]|nr:hypothetical protein [Patescibacteria group bacterium]
NPVYLQYTYYYCIDSKKRKTNCPESSIEQKVIDSHMADHFSSNLAISNPLSDWCIKHISEIKDKDLNDIRMIAESRNRAIKDTERKLTNLLDLRLDRSDLTSEEKAMYDAKERKLSTELKLLKAESKNDSSHERITEIDKSFDLMTEVIDTIKTGTLEEKKNVFYTFRSNLKFSGKKVDVLHTKWVSKFIEVLNSAKELNRAFEPRKTLADKEKTEVFASVIPTLLRR